MKQIILSTVLAAFLSLVLGCSAATNATRGQLEQPMIAESYDSGAPGAAPAAPPAPALPEPSANDSIGVVAQADGERMIVYTGSVSLEVNDTTETVNRVNDILSSVNGYISSRSLVAYGKDKLRGSIVVRIPAAALETTLGQIKALGLRVLREDSNSQDVTEEYVDLDARRKNLEAYEVELTKLLETVRERTGKAEDILAVYNQLTEVRGQIEQIRGRQRYLESTSTLATYSIEFVPVEEIVVEGQPGWDPGRTAGQALDQLVSSLQGLGDIVITFALLVIPLLVILLLPVILLVLVLRAVFRRRAPKKPATVS
jgi:hypothetical protein